MGHGPQYQSARNLLLLALMGILAVAVAFTGIYLWLLRPSLHIHISSSLLGPNGHLVASPSGPRDAENYSADGTVYLIPAANVPKTQSARYNAPADALLPDRWTSSHDSDLDVGPSNDVASISPADRQQLIAAVSGFLRAWETFTPSDNPDETLPPSYLTALQPYVASADLNSVADRLDDIQGGGVCPNYGCTTASAWTSANDVWEQSNVRYYANGNAYVNVFGSVTYTGTSPGNPLNDATFERSYGLLLRLQAGGTWMVTRAAAATDGQEQ